MSERYRQEHQHLKLLITCYSTLVTSKKNRFHSTHMQSLTKFNFLISDVDGLKTQTTEKISRSKIVDFMIDIEFILNP